MNCCFYMCHTYRVFCVHTHTPTHSGPQVLKEVHSESAVTMRGLELSQKMKHAPQEKVIWQVRAGFFGSHEPFRESRPLALPT